MSQLLGALGITSRVLTCVDVGVLLHVALLVEALPAVFALEGPRVRMDHEVGAEGRGAFEGLAALLALKHLLLSVHGAVGRETLLVAEALGTHVARERPLSVVRPGRQKCRK